MAKVHAKSFSLMASLLIVLSIAGLARFTSTAQETAKRNLLSIDPALKDLPNYRQWTRANEVPLTVNYASVGG